MKLKIEVAPAVERHLARLVRSGLYGRSKSEAAERVLCEGIATLRVKGVVLPPFGTLRKENI